MLLALLLLATPYEDTKSRFRLDLGDGWKWTPQPGDTQGAWFRKVDTGAIGNFGVRLFKLDKGTTLERIQKDAEYALVDEPGYRRLSENKLTVSGRDAVRREYTMFVAGNARTQRRVDDYFFLNGDFVYWLHFETLAEAFDLFQDDLKHMLESFVPIAGGQSASVVGASAMKIVGRWKKVDDELVMDLRADGSYVLGPASGTYSVERNALILRIPGQGEERFNYSLRGDVLTVSGVSLDVPIRYRRIEERAKGALTGRWRARNAKLGELRLSPGGQYTFGSASGNYSSRPDLLVMRRSDGTEILYTYVLDDDVLKLWGGDLSGETVFDRAK